MTVRPPAFPQAFSLEHKRALVTGGRSGLGLAIATAMAAAGADVVLAGRRADVLADAAAGIGGKAPTAALVNNAGHTVKKPFHDAVELPRHVIRRQLERGGGRRSAERIGRITRRPWSA